MFAEHQLQIAEYARRSPLHTYDVLAFVRVTIRRKFYLVPGVLEGLRKGGSLPTAQEKRFLEEAAQAAPIIHRAACDRQTPGYILRQALKLHGLGIAKSGFVAQLLTGGIGCLDTHNLRHYGFTPRTFHCEGTWEAVERRIVLYESLCESLGGSKQLWDNWCIMLSALYPDRYLSPDAVSELHLCLCWR